MRMRFPITCVKVNPKSVKLNINAVLDFTQINCFGLEKCTPLILIRTFITTIIKNKFKALMLFLISSNTVRINICSSGTRINCSQFNRLQLRDFCHWCVKIQIFHDLIFVWPKINEINRIILLHIRWATIVILQEWSDTIEHTPLQIYIVLYD